MKLLDGIAHELTAPSPGWRPLAATGPPRLTPWSNWLNTRSMRGIRR